MAKAIAAARQYRVVHEKLVLEVDMAKYSIGVMRSRASQLACSRTDFGYAEMIILPFVNSVKHLTFNCRQLDILQVLVDGVDSTFEFAQNSFQYTPPPPPPPPAAAASGATSIPVAGSSGRFGVTTAAGTAAGYKPITISLNADRKHSLDAAATAAIAAPIASAAASAASSTLAAPTPAAGAAKGTAAVAGGGASKTRPPPAPGYDLSAVRELRLWEYAEFESSDRTDFGHCIVSVPKSVRKQRKNQHKAMEDDVDITSTDDLLAPFVVHVLYRVKSTPDSTASSGVHFVKPDRALFPNRPAQCYALTSRGDASCWFPCLEGPMPSISSSAGSERCSWELEITVPASCVVVATGELTGQSYTDSAQSKKTYVYNCEVPVAPHSIGLAVGPFEITPEPRIEALTHFHIPWWTAATASAASASRATNGLSSAAASTHSASNGHSAIGSGANSIDFEYSVSCTGGTVWSCYEEYLGTSYPFPSYAQVFMDDTWDGDSLSFAGLTIFSSALLHDKSVIEQTFKTRTKLAYGLAYSWLQHSIVLKSPADLWILHGLAHYLTMLYIEKAFGNNESQWQQLMSALYVCEHDTDRDSAASADAEWRKDAEHDIDADSSSGAAAAASSSAASGAAAGPSFFLPTRPLYFTGYTHPIEMYDRVMARKAGVVMKMLELKVGKDNFQQLVRLMIAECTEKSAAQSANEAKAAAAAAQQKDVKSDTKTATAASTGPAGGGFIHALSTKWLYSHSQRVCADAASAIAGGTDMKYFFDHWVYADGYPHVKCSFHFNRKKHVTELTFTQDRNAQGGMKFSGGCRIRIHEVNRSSEHERLITGEDGSTALATAGGASTSVGAVVTTGASAGSGGVGQMYEFACASRLRRNRKRKAVEEDKLAVDDLLQRNIETPVLWVRLDPYRQWFRLIEMEQHEVMWVHQLQSDKDVVAQYEAIGGLRRLALASNAIPGASVIVSTTSSAAAASMLSTSSSSAASAPAAGAGAMAATANVLSNALRNTLENKKYFVRIRIAAAQALAETAMTRVGAKTHLQILFHYFRTQYVVGASAAAGTTANSAAAIAAMAAVAAGTGGTLKPNDFHDLPEYYLKKAIPRALCGVTDPLTRLTPVPITRFILFLLANNDNSKNQFSDSYYVSTLLRCIGQLKFAKTDSNLKSVWEELNRYLQYDQILPSYHNRVTSAVLDSMCRLEAAGVITDSKVAYHHFARYGNYSAVRVSAFRCLVTLSLTSAARAAAVVPAVIATLRDERVPGVQLAMAHAWLAVLVRSGAQQLSIFRTPNQINHSLMDALWHMLNTSTHSELRWCIYRLYMCLWGRGLPAVVPINSPLRAGSHTCWGVVRRDKLDDSRHAKRKFKARRALKERRAKRGFGLNANASGVAAANVLSTGKITLGIAKGGKIKVIDADRPDDDEL